ncbi:PREDICTED: neuronal acetylcholine receptor subunit alpha-7-like [Branchiostoma belcheri]|uniref:Neuronal acetylcholine receptor subunit alpha-7-like n=1 Tax=Branchiostoma belcheri TaxID=7741 RepID=A0A6P5A1L6_BRABE|nr:PREDICTED: neuronal acetylcholine receptor subunit alpha-7-like [Branchiostoma belcheri]
MDTCNGAFSDSLGQEAAIDLKSSLLSNYDKSLRPVKSASTAVNVDFDFSLRQIIDLAEKEQTFRLNVWLRLYWDDEFLTWNASEHDGVEYLTIHSSDVWRPDIFLYNNIAETYGVVPTITDVTVTSAGRVTYLQPAIFTSSCPVQIEKFPFDKQECELEFGSWIYTGSHLNLSLVNPYADRAVFTKNEEWILNAVPMERRVAIYPCCPEPYVSIIVKLQLERRSYFYMFNMVLPCIVLMVLNVFGFYIPPDSGERLGFSMTILLALVVFLQVLSDSLPKTSTTTPQLGQFFAATIGLVGFSCLASIVVIRLSYSSPPSRPLPRWLRLLLLRYLARLFCMGTMAEEKQVVHPAKGLEGVDNPAILIDDDEAFEQKNSATLELDLSLREISRYMRGFAHSVHEKKAEEEDQDEWKMVALVLDRVLMFAVGLGSIIVCVILLQ